MNKFCASLHSNRQLVGFVSCLYFTSFSTFKVFFSIFLSTFSESIFLLLVIIAILPNKFTILFRPLFI